MGITGACSTVEPWAAVVIGIFSGWFYLLGSKALIMLRIDDAVDAIPVHMVGGMWGVIATGLFTNEARLDAAFGMTENIGWFYEWGRGSGNFTLLGIQLLAVLFIFGWTFVIMGVYFYCLNLMGWLRIDPLEEEVGMDISRHKGSAYDINNADTNAVDALNLSRSGHKGGTLSQKKEDEASEPAEETPAKEPTNTVEEAQA